MSTPTVSGGIDLNPSLGDLLAFQPDWPMLLALLVTLGAVIGRRVYDRQER